MSESIYYDRPYNLVKEQIGEMADRADGALSRAYGAIDDLATVPPFVEGALPTPPNFEFDNLPTGNVTPPTSVDFGEVSDFRDPTVETIDVGNLEADAIPTFFSSIGSITLPAPPAAIDLSDKPVRPTLNAITIPGAPVINQPDLGDLVAINIPTFTFPELPTFDGTAPTVDFVAPNTTLIWADPVYASTNLTEIQARVSLMLGGGTGLPPYIEAALFDRARGREDMLGLKSRQEAFDSFAGRGFTMPPGMLAAQVNAVIEDNRLKASAINRDIMVKAADWEIENLRFAVQQGIALEGTLIAMFQQMAQRTFEVARYRVEAEVSLFNAKVGLFNAQQNAYQTAASVYKTRIEGALAELEVFKAEIQAQLAIGQLNEQTVKVFQAKLEATRNQVEIYKATMEGVRAQSDVNKNEIDAYKADVSAYAEGISAQKIIFDAYDSQVKGELGKTQIIEAESRAFAATVQAYDSRSNIKVKNLQVKIEAMQAATSRFSARADMERSRVTSQLGVVQARAEAYRADIGRFSAELNAQTANTESNGRLLQARLSNNLAYFEVMVKEYDARMARMLEQSKLQSEAQKAAGKMASQLAAGAMAAIHVQAGMSGSATISSTETFTHSDQL